MALVETSSLILRTYDLSDADKIVVLLTSDHGLVRGVAKGAKRLKSRFGSSLEPFSEVRVEYFQKENIELVSIQKVDIVRSVFASASEPRFLQKFSFLSDLLTSFLPLHEPNERVYRMARACIAQADADPDSIQGLGIYFKLWLLRLTGYLPEWSRCHQCGRQFDSVETADIQIDFHLLCDGCRRSRSNRSFTPQDRSIIADALRMSPADFVSRPDNTPEALTGLSSILHSLISRSLGREINGEKSITIGRHG